MAKLDAGMTREAAFDLLQEHNKDAFHIEHGETVEATMRYFAREFDPENEEFWGIVGLLHDVDYERYPGEHCVKAREILAEQGAGERLIHAVVSHGYGIVSDVAPEHEMEKILFAVDELTGLIGAAAKMRPSGSVQDMELKSLKKKYKTPSFAAGCSRDVIARGAEQLGWELDTLLERTLGAMKRCEPEIAAAVAQQTT